MAFSFSSSNYSASTSSSSSFTTSSSFTHRQRKYDVFLSFRGEDTRNNFISHLLAALNKEKILTFIDNKLSRGEEISPSLLKAIEESKLSVLIFSRRYAFSKWCLDELLKILECRKLNGQIVIPVFYWVEPSQVRNQTGSFADAFAKYEVLIEEMEKVQRWRSALKEAANISGWDSFVIRPESKLVDEIVRDVLKKLDRKLIGYSIGLVGIDPRIKQLELLLRLQSFDIRIVGIWGMAGIGKTTLARVVFDRISSQFEDCYFLVNVREQLKRCALVRFENEEHELMMENLNTGTLNLGLTSIKNQFYRKKVLIVFDDMDNSTQLQELLAEKHDLFGPGSNILITSRDKQVLKNVVDEIYVVKGLNHCESLRLFSLNAFKEDYPTIDCARQSEKVVNYVKGNPLALKVLGSALFNRSKEDWDSALRKLENVPKPEVQNALRISFDRLDGQEQKVFLDIAYFFRGEDRAYATKILDGYYSSVHFIISNLINKSLIHVSHNKLEMHDLLQEMGWRIVRDESGHPEERSRLKDFEEVCYVLNKKKGTKAIEGMFLDLSEARGMHLEADAFAGMVNLRLLKFYLSQYCIAVEDVVLHQPPEQQIRLNNGLHSLPDELRYLHWHQFPLESLPSNFCAKNLIVLSLPCSNVKQLWAGVQPLVNLRQIDLSYCLHLTRIPDLSEATNIDSINLRGCERLVELHPSIQYLKKLKFLNLTSCNNLRYLPCRFNSKVLRSLNLSYCQYVKKCPVILGKLELLDLSMTAIEELPPSIRELECLEVLNLSGCSNFTKIPEISWNLEELDLSWTQTIELPSSIEILTRLVRLKMVGCNKLLSLPSSICKLKSLKALNLSDCSKLESFPEILEPVNLEEISLINCKNLKRLPNSIYNLKSLEFLYLNGSAIKEIPSSVEHLSCLKALELSMCKNLQSLPKCIHKLSQLLSIYLNFCFSLRSLPKLPSSLKLLKACYCKSLETLSSGSSNFNLNDLDFANCLKLDHMACRKIIADAEKNIWLMATTITWKRQVRFFFPGSDIPEWFNDQSMGSSLTTQLPLNWQKFKGFAYCVVFALEDLSSSHLQIFFPEYWMRCKCYVVSDNNEVVLWHSDCVYRSLRYVKSDHVLLWFTPFTEGCEVNNKYSGNAALFQFYPELPPEFMKSCMVKKCGVHMV